MYQTEDLIKSKVSLRNILKGDEQLRASFENMRTKFELKKDRGRHTNSTITKDQGESRNIKTTKVSEQQFVLRKPFQSTGDLLAPYQRRQRKLNETSEKKSLDQFAIVGKIKISERLKGQESSRTDKSKINAENGYIISSNRNNLSLNEEKNAEKKSQIGLRQPESDRVPPKSPGIQHLSRPVNQKNFTMLSVDPSTQHKLKKTYQGLQFFSPNPLKTKRKPGVDSYKPRSGHNSNLT